MTFPPRRIDEGIQRDSISRPQVSEENAAVRSPRLAKMNVPDSHGGSVFKGRRTREPVREKQAPAWHVTDSRRIKFLSDENAHLLPGAVAAGEFVSRDEPDCLEFCVGILKVNWIRRINWRKRIGELEILKIKLDSASRILKNSAIPSRMRCGESRGNWTSRCWHAS